MGNHNYVRSDFIVKQTGHDVLLTTSADRGYKFEPGHSVRVMIDGDLTGFCFSFKGNPKPVTVRSISGSYQFQSHKPQPLELISRGRH